MLPDVAADPSSVLTAGGTPSHELTSDHSCILLALLQCAHAWLLEKPGSHFILLCLTPRYGQGKAVRSLLVVIGPSGHPEALWGTLGGENGHHTQH